MASEIAVDVIPTARRCPVLSWDRPWKSESTARGSYAGMGCTCTAAMLERNTVIAKWATAGLPSAQGADAAAHPRPLACGRPIEAGQITEAEARVPQRSVITRALGSDPRTQPDLFELTVGSRRPSASVLRRAFHDVEDDQIAKILASQRAPAARPSW